jgi:bifunctional non-homologous end joining protein LigD
MKAKLADAPCSDEWIYEIKFDGWRALALKGATRCSSRNSKDLGAKFPEIMVSIAKHERPPIFFYAFDLLQLNAKDMKNPPLEERKATLQRLLEKPPSVIRYSATLGNSAKDLLKEARKLGLEGLIGKRAKSAYEVGTRSGAWIKIKLLHEQEFVIGGYTEPEGTREFFGSLIIGFYRRNELVFVGRVGTGFSTAFLEKLYSKLKQIERLSCPFVNLPLPRGSKWGQGITASEMRFCHWVEPQLVCQLKPQLVCQVKFSELTHDKRLRQPVFLGLREDKEPKEVVLEKA